MRRSEIKKDPILMSKLNPKYYSRPTDRGDVFEVSEFEVTSASENLQKKLQQNAKKYGHLQVRGNKEVQWKRRDIEA